MHVLELHLMGLLTSRGTISRDTVNVRRITKLNEGVKHLRAYDLCVAQEKSTVFKSTG